MQQINPYLSKKPLAVGIKLIAKGFLSSLFIGFEHFDQSITEFLRRNLRPDLCGIEFRIVITPVIVVVLADFTGR